MAAPIRFGLITTKLWNEFDGAKIPTHSLVGYKYLECLSKTELFVRALPFRGMPYGLLQEDENWSQIKHLFLDERPLGDSFTNVVCGWGGIFQSMITAGCHNVAITVAWPRVPDPYEIGILNNYDVVCCPNMRDFQALREAGIKNLEQLPIHAESLVRFFDKALPSIHQKNGG